MAQKITPQKYTSIIFDIGGVLHCEEYGRTIFMVFLRKIACNFFSLKLFTILKNIYPEFKAIIAPQSYKIMDHVSSGISEPLAAEQLIEQAKIVLHEKQLVGINKDDILQFFDYMRKYTYPLPGGMKILKMAKARGYKIYLLSNIGKNDFDYTMRKPCLAEIFDLADGFVVSHQVGTIKPEAKIYTILLTKYQLKPEECLFIDNKKVNMEGGQKIGIDGIAYKNSRQVIAELKKLNVL